MSNLSRRLQRIRKQQQAGNSEALAPYDELKRAINGEVAEFLGIAVTTPGTAGVIFFLATRGDSAQDAAKALRMTMAELHQAADWILTESAKATGKTRGAD